MVIILLCDISKGIMALLNDLLLFAGVYVVYYSIKEGDKLWKKKANIEDAMKLYRIRYSKYHDIKITSIYLIKD